MNEYDVVVVGAGPGGSSAARAACEKGAKVIVLEEHPAIGYPRHCSGRIHGSSLTEGIMKNVDKRVVLSECKGRRFFAPSGKMILDTPMLPWSAYMVVREEFDRELARQAAQSGAEIVLNTRVTELLKEKGKVQGVTTSSPALPRVYGKVVIVAQGAQARRTGIPMQESLSYADETFAGGVLIELAGVHDIETGVLETHLGALVERGFACIWTRDSSSCFIAVPSLEIWARLKQGNYVFCNKIRDAKPIQIYGYVVGSKSGMPLPKAVKDGLMLVGDSAGYNNIIHAIVSGRCAGEVAATAVRSGDVSEKALAKYEDMCRKAGLHLTGLSWESLRQLHKLTDQAIEAILPEMLAKKEVWYRDVLPF